MCDGLEARHAKSTMEECEPGALKLIRVLLAGLQDQLQNWLLLELCYTGCTYPSPTVKFRTVKFWNFRFLEQFGGVATKRG